VGFFGVVWVLAHTTVLKAEGGGVLVRRLPMLRKPQE
jgi:hypothetical protein